MPKKTSMHPDSVKGKAKRKIVKRSTRKQVGEKPKWNGQEGGGPGRPKGSTLDKVWGLTPRQMDIAERIIHVNTESGLFPHNATELADKVGADRRYVQRLLRRADFQKYLTFLLLQDGIMLEMSFWRGMQLGLSVGDSKVLDLYARMTGKIAKNEATSLKVELVSPDGTRMALPTYSDDEIEDAIIIEDDIEEDD